MFQTALGRLGSNIITLSESLDLHVFIDAGGRSNSRRVWGGLACLGANELLWIDTELFRLRALLKGSLTQSGELKGKAVPTEIAKEAGAKLRQADRRILFWTNWYPEFDGAELVEMRRQLSDFLRNLHPDPFHLERAEIEASYADMRNYFDGLKPVNGHKIISIVAHLVWLFREIERANLGAQLRSAHFIIDEENLPDPTIASRFLTAFSAAGLQGAGMTFRRTGGCFRRVNTGGCHVTVAPSSKSDEHAGLQYVDILIQVVQRQLPGFSAKIP